MTLQPWQPLPVARCRACGIQAVRRITAMDGDPEFVVEGGALRIEYGPNAIRIERLACEVHAQDIGRELAMRYGGSNSVTLRMTWRYWLETRLYAAWKRVHP